METVITCCSQCEHRLGSLLNLWTQIGKRYVSPVVTTHTLDISAEGVIHQGEVGTIVDNCRVQQVVCNQCRSVLGSKCLSSSVNHVLHEGQLLLRASSIQIKDIDGHGTVQPAIQRVLNLKNPPTDEVRPEGDFEDDDHGSGSSESYNHRQTTDGFRKLDHILNQVDTQREEIERLDTAGYQIVASFNLAVQRIDEEVGNLKTKVVRMTVDLSDHSTKTKELTDSIVSIQSEINDIQKTLQPLAAQSHFGQEPSSIRNAATETDASWRVELYDEWEKHQQKLNLVESKLESAQEDFEDFRASVENDRITAKAALLASGANTEEIDVLKAELQHLRQELALERSYKSSTTNPVFAAREIDILTSSITKIGHRASQVETLQMEFELLKGRVQRMEAQTDTSRRVPAASLQQEPHHSQLVNPKRKASLTFHIEDGINSGSPSSAILDAIDDRAGQSPTAHTTTLHSPPPLKGRRNSSRPGIPKLTKSGAVDKRTLKKRSSKSTTS
ncbi:hypothetical protein F4859DRAFT_302345 [Xylaria cf. heliscus]|nr:hypothetical protein F4859DRAFT_302345 [Xylaria cf. heliscus]